MTPDALVSLLLERTKDGTIDWEPNLSSWSIGTLWSYEGPTEWSARQGDSYILFRFDVLEGRYEYLRVTDRQGRSFTIDKSDLSISLSKLYDVIARQYNERRQAEGQEVVKQVMDDFAGSAD